MATKPTTPSAAAAGARNASTIAVRVLTPVEHDGRRYEPGESLALDPAAAAALAAVGAAELPPADPAAAPESQ